MAAGLATLKLISRPGFHDELTDYTARLLQGLQERADAAGIPFTTTQAGGMFGIYFTDRKKISPALKMLPIAILSTSSSSSI